jgi:hypothetical protein
VVYQRVVSDVRVYFRILIESVSCIGNARVARKDFSLLGWEE